MSISGYVDTYNQKKSRENSAIKINKVLQYKNQNLEDIINIPMPPPNCPALPDEPAPFLPPPDDME